MEANRFGVHIINNLTKVFNSFFRYFLPGSVALLAYAIASPPLYCPSLTAQYVSVMVGLAVILGFSLYAVHRTWISLLEIGYFRTECTAVSNYRGAGENRIGTMEAWAQFTIDRQKLREFNRGLSDYLDMRWSLAHSSAILSYIAVSFLCVYKIDDCPLWIRVIAGLFFLAISYSQLIRLYVLEKHIMRKMRYSLGMDVA